MATVGRSHTPTDRNTPSDRVRTAAKENFALLLSRATTQIALPLSRAPTQNALPRSSAFRSDGVLRSVGGWDLPMLRDRIWFRCVAPARKRAHNHKYGSNVTNSIDGFETTRATGLANRAPVLAFVRHRRSSVKLPKNLPSRIMLRLVICSSTIALSVS